MLPKVQKGGFREYERWGCPIVNVGGLECVSLQRVSQALNLPRKQTCKLLANPSRPLLVEAACGPEK